MPRWLSGGRDTVGVRLTDHPVAARAVRAHRPAIVSTSANVSRSSTAARRAPVRRELGAAVDYVLAGEVGGLAQPTMIKDGRTGRILRGA